MTDKRLLSQSQIIRRINSQTRKNYKLFNSLLKLRPLAPRISFDNYQESTTPVSRTLVSGDRVSNGRKLRE